MKLTNILNPSEVRRVKYEDAETAFLKHCKIKNLSPQTLAYYKENTKFFHATVPVKYIDEVTQELLEDFIVSELDAGKKVTSLNTRIRGLRVFFKFCAEREYMTAVDLKLMKEDDVIKEPYTEAELRRLLKRPASNSWVEWRTWAAVNYLIATGNRVGTIVNVKIQDVNIDDMTIHLTTVKNRRQQLVPLSPALCEVLSDYYKTWKWNPDDFLFPSNGNKQLDKRGFQMSIMRYNIARGVTKTSAHLFRHTFAKNFILAGGGLIQLQALLGHSTMDMTRKYVNLYGMDLQRDYEKLNPLDNLMKGDGNNV